MSPLIERAFALALELHGTQSRKASIVPNAAYMSHLTEVAGMVWGSLDSTVNAEVIVAAALLHDAIEDQPEKSPWSKIIVECGPEVLNLVEDLTEAGTGSPDGKKAPWLERKQDYLNHIAKMSTSVLLISVCDKLQSARELKRQVKRQGDRAYRGFVKEALIEERRGLVLWFHSELVNSYRTRCAILAGPADNAVLAGTEALIEEFAEVVEWLESR